MSQPSPVAPSPLRFSLASIPMHIWDILTKPALSVQGPDRRRVRLLSAFLVIYTPFTTLLLLGLSTRISSFTFTPLIMGGLIAIWASYFLSRSRFYKAAMVLAVISVNLNAWTSILAGSPVGVAALYDALISILLSSILLPLPFTATQIIINVVAMLVLPAVHPGIGDLSGLLLFTIILSVLLLAFIWQRDLLETDRRTELLHANDKLRASEGALQQANITLEQKVEQRTAELKRAKEEAEQANHVKSAFLAGMSHELRTPLNAIINFTTFVTEGDLGPVNEMQQETLNEVLESSNHLLNLINDVLDMSKIEAGSLNLFIEDNVDLISILQSVEATAKALRATTNVELTFDVEANLPPIRADRQRILQILLNIMSNACKFTKEGSIALQARLKDDNVLISVKDTGPGIASEDQTVVFDAFKQTETGLRQGTGTGLGMPIAKNLTQAHGGQLWLESELGKGATFFVSLPVKSQQLVPLYSAAASHK